MNSLSRALERHDADELATLIWRRLRGEHLDIPYDRSRGETSREALVALYTIAASNDSPQIRIFQSALKNVWNTFLCAELADVSSGKSAVGLPSLLEFFGLIEDIGAKGFDEYILNSAVFAMPFVYRTDVTRSLAISYLRAAAKYIHSNDLMLQICSLALNASDAELEVALALAAVAPQAFRDKLVPSLLFELRERGTISEEQHARIKECIRLSLVPLVENGNTGELRSAVDRLCSVIAATAHFPSGRSLHRSTVQAISLANAPASEIRLFEDKYWDEHPKKEWQNDTKFMAARTLLANRIKTFIRAGRPRKGPPIRVNSFPYAEAAFFHLLRIALKLVHEVDVDVVSTEYNSVKQALLDGKIDFAIHNPSILEQIVEKTGEEILTSPPIIEFSRYEILASTKLLMELALGDAISENARRVALDLLSADDINLDYFRKNSREIEELLKIGRLTCLIQSDTHDVARAALSEANITLLVSYMADSEPDQGFEKVLDGEVLFYIGGAMQSHYGSAICDSRVRRVLDIEKSVNVHFYVKKKNFAKNAEIYNLIVDTWNAVDLLWNFMSEKDRIIQNNLIDLIQCIREDILITLNRDQEIRIGFLPSFEDLKAVILRHDRILKIDSKPNHFTPATIEEGRPYLRSTKPSLKLIQSAGKDV